MHFWTYLTCNYVLLTCKMKQVNKKHLLCFPYIWCKLCTHHNECLHQRRWGISILAYLSHTMIKATLSNKIALSLSLSKYQNRVRSSPLALESQQMENTGFTPLQPMEDEQRYIVTIWPLHPYITWLWSTQTDSFNTINQIG